MKPQITWAVRRIARMTTVLAAAMTGIFGTVFLRPQGTNVGQNMNSTKMEIKKERFGTTADGQEVDLYTMSHGEVMKVKITNYGGIVTELWVPDKKGKMGDVVLGFDSLKQYLATHPYFGCLVGRYANRIAKGKFTLDGVRYTLATNNNGNHLHGGLKGFDKAVWQAEPAQGNDSVSLKLTYLSKDGEEGYPGNLTVNVIYTLSKKNELNISYSAKTDKATVVNLTHHSYFNLTGARSGDVLKHEMMVNANRYTAVDKELIPTGEVPPVKGTPMDFTIPHPIGARIEQVAGGYDNNYVLNLEKHGVSLAARVYEPESGRLMEVWTTEPGIQFYTGNFLDGTIKGKRGYIYKKYFGFCLEAQHFPDSPNHPDFPSVVLRPGETYRQTTTYKFLTKN